MTGTLSQLIALASYGNAYLQKKEMPEGFGSSNSAFTFCNKVDFRVFERSFFSKTPKEDIVGDTPEEWFAYLKQTHCNRLVLYYEGSKDQSQAKDHQLAGFIGGGGTWFIEAIYEKHSNFWAARWEVTDQQAPDNKIWRVNYGMFSGKQAIHNLQFDKEQVKQELYQTLESIADFATAQNLGSWAGIFERAKAVLDSPAPSGNYYHKDLFPSGIYGQLSQQLLFAAGSAWVFGGMGSWNDLGFESDEDNDRYSSLSAALYSAINTAIIAAVNSPGQP